MGKIQSCWPCLCLTMGTLQQVLLIFLGHFLTAQSYRRLEDSMFPQDFGGFLDNNWLFPFDRNFDFPPLDTIFSSWRSWSPGFHMFGEIPPITSIPRVQVFCDETKLSVAVEKKAFGLTLTDEEIQLGDGCYSNKELPNQFVFDYDLDQCGTTPVFQNGWQVFTNSLHLNPKKTPPTWGQTPPTIHISCIPKRSYTNPNVTQQSANAKHFKIEAMTPSWTTIAESNLYKRGQVVHLQVSAKMRPDQQLFIHSCFVSASSEPQTRPRHAVIFNKGCVSSLGSPAQFAPTKRADVVHFNLNTSNLLSEFYVHCSVVALDQGLTSISKSCNYNVNKSRWEELNGADVCGCCSLKCKSPSKNLSHDAKAVVSIGPLVIMDDDRELNPALPESKPQTFSSLPTTMMSDAPNPAEDVSASPQSQSMLESTPQGVVMVSQNPATRLTLWLPGQVQAEHSNMYPFENGLSMQPGDHPEQQFSATEETLTSPTNEVVDLTNFKADPLTWDMKFATLTDSWPVSSPDKIEAFPRNRFGRSGNLAAQADSPFPPEIDVGFVFEKSKQISPHGETGAQTKWLPADVAEPVMEDESSQMDTTEPEVDVQPIIHTKLEFMKGADGSKRLSYEEEVKQKVEKLLQREQEPRLKGLRSTFLNLLRRIEAE